MPTRITSTTLARGILADIARANQRLSRTQEQLSSGKALNQPSDDPSAVGRALELRTELEGARQYQRNASEAQGWADVTDSALAAISSSLIRVRELTVQGASDSAGTSSRLAIAQEVKGLIDSVKTAANASYGGRYVFAGSKTDVQPYDLADLTDAYAGDTLDVARQIGAGVTVPVNISGQEAIGSGSTGLIGALRDVLAHLEGDDGPALVADLQSLDARMDDLNAVRAKVGATANRLEAATARLSEYEGTTLKLLSDTEDTDIAKAMIDFSTQQAALTAGLKAGASIVQSSLLDFLR